jgi:hypothetical protein
MAAEKTETTYNVSPNLNGKIIKFEFEAAATGDWVIFSDPVGCVKAQRLTGADSATLYATGSTCAVASATATTLTGGSFTAEQRPASGYIMQDTEIMKYSGATKSATTGDLTLDARGCFGTTAAIHTSGTGYVLNTIVFTTAAGLMRGIADIIEE